MILLAADNHYGQHGGRVLAEQLGTAYPLDFHEDDWRCFERPDFAAAYELVVLHMIADTCKIAPPGPAAEANVKAYLQAGGSMVLLHGSSAAFWHWDWWRPLVGFRWVRGGDPDGVPASTHPVRPFHLARAKTRHPLAARLVEIDLPEDEIYINLEQTCPAWILLQTTTDEGTFPQAYATTTPWGGTLLSYLPGHRPHVVAMPEMLANVRTLIDTLRGGHPA